MIRKGLEHVGGTAWRCLRCLGYVSAACLCCEPPACNCWRIPLPAPPPAPPSASSA